MRLAKIENNKVENIIIADEIIEGYIEIPDNIRAGIGWDYDNGFIEPVEEPIQRELTQLDRMASVQLMINNKARELGYINIADAAVFDGSSIVKFDQDAKALKEWYAQVKQSYDQIESDIASNTRTAPTIEELINELPGFGS